MDTATIEISPGVGPSPVTFKALALEVRDAGLLDRRHGYYATKIGLTVAALGAGWFAFVIIGNSWSTLAIAAFLGVMFTQLGFLGHDAGHQQVFSSRRANRLLGLLVGDTLTGLSFGWWVPKHSAHHAHPNEIGLDPDIEGSQDPSTIADGGSSVGSKVGRFIARWQAPLFFPLMLFRSTGLHVLGIRDLLRRDDRASAVELLLVGVHVGVYLSLVVWVLGPVKGLTFIAVQQGVFSIYLGCSFAPNHKGMPIIPEGAQMNFAARQVVTARNVTGGRLTTFMLGGLNYQIEHHLFPVMPRPNLKRAQSLVRKFCLANDLGYCEDSTVGSFVRIIQHLSSLQALNASSQLLAA